MPSTAGNAHPGCCVVPTALALGEELGAPMDDVITAMVAGYELYVRIGYLASPDLLNAGWQPHSVVAFRTDDNGGVPLLEGKRRVDGRPTVYLCERFACRAPITDPEELTMQRGGA